MNMLSPAVTRTLIDHFSEPALSRRAPAQEFLRGLSDREREVAAQVGRGLSNADIARQLYMSEATVKAHLSRVLTKLNATNRVQVAIVVRDAGLT
jgi:DNA-binding NarL/FixJ family response regulator